MHIVVAVRGTNAKAILDWIREDGEVFRTRKWEYGTPPPGARISESTYLGLGILNSLEPASGTPGSGTTIGDFLKAEVAANRVSRIDITGHSLAGALAPTLTLYLADTQSDWDPMGKASLRVTSFAGPTAGNVDFAQYSDSRIGTVTHRVHNPYDIVPMAWNLGTLEEIPSLYDPVVKFPKGLKLLLDGVLIFLDGKNYAQIRPDAPPFSWQTLRFTNHLRGTSRMAAHLRLFLWAGFGRWKVQALNGKLQAARPSVRGLPLIT